MRSSSWKGPPGGRSRASSVSAARVSYEAVGGAEGFIEDLGVVGAGGGDLGLDGDAQAGDRGADLVEVSAVRRGSRSTSWPIRVALALRASATSSISVMPVVAGGGGEVAAAEAGGGVAECAERIGEPSGEEPFGGAADDEDGPAIVAGRSTAARVRSSASLAGSAARTAPCACVERAFEEDLLDALPELRGVVWAGEHVGEEGGTCRKDDDRSRVKCGVGVPGRLEPDVDLDGFGGERLPERCSEVWLLA